MELRHCLQFLSRDILYVVASFVRDLAVSVVMVAWLCCHQFSLYVQATDQGHI